ETKAPIAIWLPPSRALTGMLIELLGGEATCPLPFWPQHQTTPSSASAHVCCVPAERPTAGLGRRSTRTGAAEDVYDPLPNWPEGFPPQQKPAPSVRRAQVWNCPTRTSSASLSSSTRMGVRTQDAHGKVPPLSPSWPNVSVPQQ